MNNTPFVLSISQRGSEGRTSFSLVSVTHANSTVMAEVPAPGVQFPQPQAPQAPQAMNPPVQAANDIAPAPQPVQVNVANAQDELEVNFEFGISFIVLIGLSGGLAFLFVGGTIVSFCFATVVEVLTAIMHILVRVSGLT